ncbi:unnamed protein product, partial [Agarophyton chilense]
RTRARKPLAHLAANQPPPPPPPRTKRTAAKQQAKQRTTARATALQKSPSAPPSAVVDSAATQQTKVEQLPPVERAVITANASPEPRDMSDESPAVDIAQITSQLEGASISAAAVPEPCAAPPVRNPFGGVLPAPTLLSQPKRPLTAYQHYCKLQRDAVAAAHPDADFAAINSLLGAAWRALSAEQRAPFEAAVADDRVRYHQQLAEYKHQQHAADKERHALQFYQHQLKVQKALELYDRHLAERNIAEHNHAEHNHAEHKPPAPPKQPRNAYNFFVAARSKDAGAGSAFALTAHIADQWRALQASRKKKDKTLVAKFNKMAAEDELRFRAETEQYNAALAEHALQKAHRQQQFKKDAMDAYEASLKDKHDANAFRKLQAERNTAQKELNKKLREEKKAAKQAKAAEPKRPRNAYAIFFSKNAAQVSEYIKINNVQQSMAKEIAARWKALSDTDREPYVSEAEQDRVRYTNEINTFNAAQQ